MKKITERIVNANEQDCTGKVENEYVVNGEGCLDDCPHHDSWTSETIGCGWHNTSFISSKK